MSSEITLTAGSAFRISTNLASNGKFDVTIRRGKGKVEGCILDSGCFGIMCIKFGQRYSVCYGRACGYEKDCIAIYGRAISLMGTW
jgi:hypothetical protein